MFAVNRKNSRLRAIRHRFFDAHNGALFGGLANNRASCLLDVDDRVPPKPGLITIFAVQRLRPLRPPQLASDGERANSTHTDCLNQIGETLALKPRQNVIDRAGTTFQGAIGTLPFNARAAPCSELRCRLIGNVRHWCRDIRGEIWFARG